MFETPLPDLLMLLAAAVAIVTAFRALNLSPVLGYLAAGAVIGPGGLKLIHDTETMEGIADFGIVFLMFLIGLELSWDRLKAMRSQVLVLGSLQVLLTAIAFAAIAHGFGLPWTIAMIVGSGLALSSTALVLQVLESRNELSGPTGRLALAILILQDLVVLPLLVLLPMLAHREGSILHELGTAGMRAVVALIGIVFVGRLLVRPLFRVIARLRSEELFVATTLLVVFATAWVTESVGLSSALGAFVAGLLLAETEFQHQIEVDVKPFKSLLMGLFFMTVGMKIDLPFLHEHALDVVLGALIILGVKTVILFGLLRLRGKNMRTSAHTALLLAQGGEFGFILFSLAAQLGLIEAELSARLLVAITVSMAVTPLLDTCGAWIEQRWWRRVRISPEQSAAENQDLKNHIIVVGFGSMGQLVTEFLMREKIPFVVVDRDPLAVAAGRRQHMPVFYGDAIRKELLDSVGVARAAAVILTPHEAEQSKGLFLALHLSYPQLPILLRTNDFASERRLRELGAAVAVPELQVSSMRLIAGLLTQLGRPEEEIRRVMQSMRG